VREHALAHAIPDRTEDAYARSDMLAKRARLMADWAKFCHLKPGQAGSVTPINQPTVEVA